MKQGSLLGYSDELGRLRSQGFIKLTTARILLASSWQGPLENTLSLGFFSATAYYRNGGGMGRVGWGQIAPGKGMCSAAVALTES